MSTRCSNLLLVAAVIVGSPACAQIGGPTTDQLIAIDDALARIDAEKRAAADLGRLVGELKALATERERLAEECRQLANSGRLQKLSDEVGLVVLCAGLGNEQSLQRGGASAARPTPSVSMIDWTAAGGPPARAFISMEGQPGRWLLVGDVYGPWRVSGIDPAKVSLTAAGGSGGSVVVTLAGVGR